ncbi:MAG: T9SS type A sorting domain-containing protein [Bacteroidetes bacterium]|nr:T9SS type A sorting domain-containing protein [Bacteroidota bacterium]
MIILAVCAVSVRAEGTRQFRPTKEDVGNLQINDKNRPFALESNSDPLYRLYFHISSTSEKVFLGFRHDGTGQATFRILDPSGTVVFQRTPIPTTTGAAGYINSYEEAVAGPLTQSNLRFGYLPIAFTPSTTGDFYIEFSTDLPGAYNFDLFDVAVTDAQERTINGRLWAYAWDLTTRSYTGRYNGSFFVYSADAFVTRVDLNGIQPYGFVVSCNSSGPGNLSNGDHENRKSVEGNHIRPEYKIFLNDPDPAVYASGEVPVIFENIHLIRPPFAGEEIPFVLSISTPGTVQLVLDINNQPGYQPGSEDVILIRNVRAGIDTIIWDGKNAFGSYVTGGTTVLLLSSFATGITHLPLFDPETHENGYVVDRIRPVNGLCGLYWDDTNFPGGTFNIDTSSSGGHSFPDMFGDERTMNTWWNGYELDILNHFEFELLIGDLALNLISLKAGACGESICVTWETAYESSCSHYVIEKSTDGGNFYPIGEVDCIDNSNSTQDYTFFDPYPYSGRTYYRVKRVDFSGNFECSNTVHADYSIIRIATYPNPVAKGEFINIYHSGTDEELKFQLMTIDGKPVGNESGNKPQIIIPASLKNGMYVISVSNGSNNYIQRIIVSDP